MMDCLVESHYYCHRSFLLSDIGEDESRVCGYGGIGICGQWDSRRNVRVCNVVPVLFVIPPQIAGKKVTICSMISWFAPYHWKGNATRCPLSKFFCTCPTYIMWNPWFVLVTKPYAKIGLVCFLQESSYGILCYCFQE